ncbi:MAG: queuosine precursor transporter [Clostridia bacterium]
MNTIVLWLILMLVNFLAILLFYKLFDDVGLYSWIAISAIIANIQVLKTIELFGFVVTLGNIIYGTSFLATDILSEVYGKEKAKKGVYIGLLTLVSMTLIMQLSLMFIPHESDFAQGALQTIFGIMPRIAFASFVAYFISQLHDVWAFDYWKGKLPERKYLWLRNNLSTLVSQLIDSVVFTGIAFYGVFEFNVFLQILISTYVLKLVVALMDTPFVYIATKIKN